MRFVPLILVSISTSDMQIKVVLYITETLSADSSVYYQEVDSLPSPTEELDEIHTTSMVIICLGYFTCSYSIISELVRYGL